MYVDYYLYYLSYFSSLYFGYPLIIRITAVVILGLTGMTIFGLLNLFFLGYKFNRNNRRRRNTMVHFEEKLSFIMQNINIYEVKEINELLQYDDRSAKKWKPAVVTDILLTVKRAV